MGQRRDVLMDRELKGEGDVYSHDTAFYEARTAYILKRNAEIQAHVTI